MPKGTEPWNKGKGKGWTDPRGYRWLYVSEGGKNVARREHRVLMEQHLGRRLEPWEIVHHKDGDPGNNDLSNLEVQEFGAHTAAHHTGTRKSWEARRSMEAFALLREELKRERAVKADLLAALQAGADALHNAVLSLTLQLSPDHEDARAGATAIAKMDAAIAKALGQDGAK